jgi:DNA repair protein RecO (recombination protein O)
MALFSAEALVLDVRDFQEQDRIVTVLTREYGKRRGVAAGARKKFSRFAGQLQPLARVHLTWWEKEGRDLVRLSDVAQVRSADFLQQDLEGILLSAYLAEHVTELAQESEPSELYFRLLDSTIEALAVGVDRDLATRYFEAWMLRLAGVFPAPRECPSCGRPFPGGAVLPKGDDALLCLDCAREVGASGGLEVAEPVLELLRRIGREALGNLAEAPPPRAVLRRVEELSTQLRRRFLDRELKSYTVMRRTLGETGSLG